MLLKIKATKAGPLPPYVVHVPFAKTRLPTAQRSNHNLTTINSCSCSYSCSYSWPCCLSLPWSCRSCCSGLAPVERRKAVKTILQALRISSDLGCSRRYSTCEKRLCMSHRNISTETLPCKLDCICIIPELKQHTHRLQVLCEPSCAWLAAPLLLVIEIAARPLKY